METIQTLTNLMAAELTALQEQYREQGGTVAAWEIRGELGTDTDKPHDLIAVLTFGQSREEVPLNKTLRLTGELNGMLRIGARTDAQCAAELKLMAEVVADYLGGMSYTELGDAVVIQATSETVTYSRASPTAYSFSLAVEAVVQF